MKKIANILTKYKMEDSDMFNITDDESSLIEGIPTVIVGWERAKSIIKNPSIIDWKADDLTYWVFSKRENNSKYTERLKEFKEIAIKRFIKSIKYSFFNVLTSERDEKNEFMKMFLGGETFFISGDNMLYSFVKNENCVYGISLMDVDYEGKNPSAVLDYILSTGNKIMKVDEVPFSVRNLMNNSTYVLPYIYSE